MLVRLRSYGAGLLVLFVLAVVGGSALAAARSLTEAEAVSILQGYGIVKGDPSGALMLDQQLTRAQAAAVFVRSRGAQNLASMLADQVPFTDMDGHWAAGEVSLAYRLGLVKGDGDGRFRPDSPISYVEVLTVLLRMVEQEPAGPWNPMLILEAASKAGISPTGVDLMTPAVRGKIFWSLR